MNIAGRIAKLEAFAGVGKEPHHVITVFCNDGESHDAAADRYRREHPETPEYAEFIVIRFVAPV